MLDGTSAELPRSPPPVWYVYEPGGDALIVSGRNHGVAYLEATAHDDVAVIRVRPERWRTTDFAKM